MDSIVWLWLLKANQIIEWTNAIVVKLLHVLRMLVLIVNIRVDTLLQYIVVIVLLIHSDIYMGKSTCQVGHHILAIE